MDVIPGKLRQNLLFICQCRLQVGCVGDLQPDMLVLGHAAETGLNVVFHGVDHDALALVGGPGLGKGIQLVPLDLQHGL